MQGMRKEKDVLSNLSVEVKEGEIFAAVGANGSRKINASFLYGKADRNLIGKIKNAKKKNHLYATRSNTIVCKRSVV